jgi:ribose-phosphate pyrophosphokinase
MVDTAGTLVKAAEVLKKRGATSVMACCTHGVLSGPAYDRIEKGELDELVISDTIPAKKEIKKITVLTASAIIGEAIRRIHNNESVNSIFNN